MCVRKWWENQFCWILTTPTDKSVRITMQSWAHSPGSKAHCCSVLSIHCSFPSFPLSSEWSSTHVSQKLLIWNQWLHFAFKSQVADLWRCSVVWSIRKRWWYNESCLSSPLIQGKGGGNGRDGSRPGHSTKGYNYYSNLWWVMRGCGSGM